METCILTEIQLGDVECAGSVGLKCLAFLCKFAVFLAPISCRHKKSSTLKSIGTAGKGL